MTSKNIGELVAKNIDKAVAEKNNKKDRDRRHLGASGIGKDCARSIYYAWRWFYITQHKGRLHRLWNRGHLEEFRFVEYLRLAGYQVRDYKERLMYHAGSDSYTTLPWDGDAEEHAHVWAECDDVSENRWHIQRCEAREAHLPKGERLLQQYGFKAHMGHFGGNDDGRVSGPELPEGWGLFEAKTYNDKRFKTLVAKGVKKSDPTYYNQMQTYMRAHGLKWALFGAVNKNDDELHFEVIPVAEEIGAAYWDRAEKIIQATQPPQRISEDASWFKCKMCDYREICHKGDMPQKNCRTCQYSVAAADGRFYCNAFRNVIPSEFEAKGCDNWDPIL